MEGDLLTLATSFSVSRRYNIGQFLKELEEFIVQQQLQSALGFNGDILFE